MTSKILQNSVVVLLIWLLLVQSTAAWSPIIRTAGSNDTDKRDRRTEDTRKRPRKDAPNDKVAEKKAKSTNPKKLLKPQADLEGQSATLLPDGRWLLLGGRKGKEIVAT